MSGEGLVAFGVEDLLPLAEKVLGDVERAGGLGEGVAFVGDQLDGSGLELSGERLSSPFSRSYQIPASGPRIPPRLSP